MAEEPTWLVVLCILMCFSLSVLLVFKWGNVPPGVRASVKVESDRGSITPRAGGFLPLSLLTFHLHPINNAKPRLVLPGGVSVEIMVRYPANRLAAETEALDGFLIALRGGVFQIVQQAPAEGHQLQQTAAGREVLLVRAKVLREVIDALAEERDLIIGTAGITRVQLVLSRIDGIRGHFRRKVQQQSPYGTPLPVLPWDRCGEVSIVLRMRNWFFGGEGEFK
jgi:hypothetical protein